MNIAQEASGPLSVTWPLDNSYYTKTSREQVMGKTPIASSINHSIRVLIAGKGVDDAGSLEVVRHTISIPDEESTSNRRVILLNLTKLIFSISRKI